MSEVKVNKVSPRSGTGLQLGDSGDTITIPSGATLANSGTATGFAAIDWQSTIVTGATHTASANQGIWIDTSSNACNLTLPGSPSAGDQLIFADVKRKWDTNAVTLTLNGSKYQGNTTPVPVYDTAGEAVHIVYSGATTGWVPINDGATIMETPQTYSASYLVVAGGASGGKDQAAGGGAGGLLTNVGGAAITLTGGATYTITVGAGGAARTSANKGDQGGNSVISGSGITTVTALGGGGGGCNSGSANNGNDGGSGGGGAYPGGSAGSGTSPQGNDGGSGAGGGTSPAYGSGGGGGAGAGGANGSASSGGNGGNGLANSITGSSVTYAGGGGGYAINSSAGSGGSGGGGAGGGSGGAGTAATANTGGGGGGAGGNSGAGGSGVVILSVPDADYSGTTTGSPTVATGVSGQTIITFTGSGTYTG